MRRPNQFHREFPGRQALLVSLLFPGRQALLVSLLFPGRQALLVSLLLAGCGGIATESVTDGASGTGGAAFSSSAVASSGGGGSTAQVGAQVQLTAEQYEQLLAWACNGGLLAPLVAGEAPLTEPCSFAFEAEQMANSSRVDLVRVIVIVRTKSGSTIAVMRDDTSSATCSRGFRINGCTIELCSESCELSLGNDAVDLTFLAGCSDLLAGPVGQPPAIDCYWFD